MVGPSSQRRTPIGARANDVSRDGRRAGGSCPFWGSVSAELVVTAGFAGPGAAAGGFAGSGAAAGGFAAGGCAGWGAAGWGAATAGGGGVTAAAAGGGWSGTALGD